MAVFGNGKLVPPGRVLVTDLSGVLESRLHQRITEEVLCEAGIEERVAATLRRIALSAAEDLRSEFCHALVDQLEVSWRAALERTAARLLTAQATP